MKLMLLTLMALGMVCPAHSQTVQTSIIQWNVDGFADNLHRSKGNLESKFITRGDKSIRWVQKNESFAYDFQISSIEGSWVDLKKNGALIYHVIFDKKPGTIKISRSGSTFVLNMNFSGLRAGDFSHDFSISSFRVL
jgi:hypothetical protein